VVGQAATYVLLTVNTATAPPIMAKASATAIISFSCACSPSPLIKLARFIRA